MSAPDGIAPTRDLIDDLLDNRPEVYQRAKMELLARLANTKKERLRMGRDGSKAARK